jgi:hypothetical protein
MILLRSFNRSNEMPRLDDGKKMICVETANAASGAGFAEPPAQFPLLELGGAIVRSPVRRSLVPHRSVGLFIP